MLQANPKSVFSSWVDDFKRAYRDNVEVPYCFDAAVLRCFVLRKSFWRSSYCVNLSSRTIWLRLVWSPVIWLQEYERRFEIWADNLDFIESYNSDDKTHWVS